MAFNSNSTHVNDSYVYDEELIPMCEDDYEKTTGVCYATIFCLSILGNGFLVCALTCYEDLKRATNLFMFCLALFDLLFTLTLPFWCVELLHHWVFGDVVCKIMTGAYFVGIYGSLILLTAMTLDRFVVVVVRSYWLTRSRRLKCSKAACIGAWIISLIACLRDSIAAKTRDEHINKYSCQSTSTVDDNVGYYTQLILLFLVPFAIIVFCYTKIILTLMSTSTRQKYRTVILVLCIVIAFFICWGPYHIIIVLMSIYDFDHCKHYRMYVAFIVCRILAFSHCCINPALYIVRGKYRNLVSSLLFCSPELRQSGLYRGPTDPSDSRIHPYMNEGARENCEVQQTNDTCNNSHPTAFKSQADLENCVVYCNTTRREVHPLSTVVIYSPVHSSE
uniref:G-protein coupled receptors family 1 profile domain-containing protein n=1 Tax=Cyprinus carpio TaxID=7962 RepID=A0A8C2F3M8_CYPCA